MTMDRALEDRLAAWYRQGDDTWPAPGRLMVGVLAIPDARHPSGVGWLVLPWVRGRALVALVLLSAVLTGLGVAGATGILQLGPVDRVRPLPIAMDACDVLVAAFGPNRLPHRVDGDHGTTAWGADVCVHDLWDGSYEDRHLFLRMAPTSGDEARRLIADTQNWQPTGDPPNLPMVWTALERGVWIGRSPLAGGGTPVAIAVSHEPYFFIVTDEVDWKAIRWAQDVAEVLGFELQIDAPSAPGPTGS